MPEFKNETLDEIRLRRIEEGQKKYGPWIPENFTDRDLITMAIEELADALNYVEMSYKMGRLTFWQYHIFFERIHWAGSLLLNSTYEEKKTRP
jgi:hypothetical protein